MIIINFIYFLFLLFFAFYIPGNLLIKVFKVSNKDLLINTVLSFSLGIALFMVSVYLLSWINLEFYYNLFLVLCLLFFLRNLRGIKIQNIKYVFRIEYLIIFVGSVFTCYLMWRSGGVEGNNLVFYGVNSVDAIYHLSVIGSLKSNFPPMHPGLFEIPLRGYNFFYDLIIAYFSKFYHLETLDLFFRYFPLFLSLFYGLSGWALGKFMKMQKETVLVFITLLYFAQSFFIFVFNSKPALDSGIVQTIANIVNPSVILSVSLLFSFYILTFSVKTKFSLVLSALILGILPMIKIYTGFLVFISIGLIFLLRLIRNKDIYYFPILFFGFSIAFITYVPINFGSGSLIFAPNLLYRHYLESISSFYNLNWYQRLLVYEEHNNYIKIILYKFILVLPLFYLPSLGLRLLNIFHIKKLLNKNMYSEANLFWGFVVAFGFLIPSFFIQSTSAFVVLQFLWISYFVLLIPTAFSLTNFFKKMNNRKLAVIIAFIIALSLPDDIKLYNLYSQNPYKIDLNLYEVTREISKIPIDKGVIVLNVSKVDKSYSVPYTAPIISGLSSHSVYFEPELTEFGGIEEVISSRKKLVGDLGEALTTCSNPLEMSIELKNKADQVKSPYILDLKNTPCFDKLENVKLIYRKSNYSLYKVL